MQEKVNTISNLFEGHQIRSIWDSELEDYHFSVVDVIEALTDSSNPRDYWYKLKNRMNDSVVVARAVLVGADKVLLDKGDLASGDDE